MFKNLIGENWRNLRTWRPFFIIFVIGFLLYSQTLWFNFTYLDDNVLVLQNAAILGNFHNLGLIFSRDVFMSGPQFYYRPLLNIYLMIGAHLAGTLPFIYHLGNILLHITAVSLIFILLDKILKKKTLAFWLSLIFLVHPVLTQAVAWIPGSNDSLLAIFIIAAFLAWRSFSRQPRLPVLILYGVFFFLALLSKETAAVLPLIGLVYFLTLGRRDRSTISEKFLLLAFSLVPLAVWWLLRSLVLGQSNISLAHIWTSLISNLGFAFIIAAKMIWPVHLSVLAVKADSPFIYALIIWLLLTLVLMWSHRKRWDYILFGAAWFFFFLLPPFAVFNQAPYFLEHRLYLPLIGFLIILAEIDWLKDFNFKKRGSLIIAIALILVLASLTFYYSKNFINRMTFWQTAVADSPHSPLAQKNLAVMYYFNGDYTQAEQHDKLALQLNSQETMVHNNLGVIYMNQGKNAQAAQEFKQELDINPGYPQAEANLRALYYRENKLR